LVLPTNPILAKCHPWQAGTPRTQRRYVFVGKIIQPNGDHPPAADFFGPPSSHNITHDGAMVLIYGVPWIPSIYPFMLAYIPYTYGSYG
jgi:hypothetical protein